MKKETTTLKVNGQSVEVIFQKSRVLNFEWEVKTITGGTSVTRQFYDASLADEYYKEHVKELKEKAIT